MAANGPPAPSPLHTLQIAGKKLKVTWAKPRDQVPYNTNVYVSGMPLDTTELQFSEFW